ncbi:MAG: zf-HC2 domain-containing protein [Vicinamibacteria bacterium]
MSAHPSAEQLSAFLDQELPESARLPLEEHLRTCDVCAAHLAELAAVDDAARTLPLEEPAGYFDDFAARVRARVDTRRPRRTLPVWSFAAAAALLLAVVTPLALRERAAQAPTAAVVRDDAPAPAAQAVPAPPASLPQVLGANAEPAKEADRAQPEGRARRQIEAEREDRLLVRDRPAGRALEFQKQMSQDKAERAAARTEPAPAPPRLAEKTVDELKALGYSEPSAAVAPAPAGQRPHGPRSQQFAPPPPPAAPPPAADEAASGAPVASRGLDGVRDADLAKGKDDRSERAKRSAASDVEGALEGATAGGAGMETRLGATASVAKPAPARTADEARRRREAFRRMAGERPDDASLDEARVGVIEEGVRAFRLEGRAEDRAMAERDGRAYLARPDALQAPRVRALLKELSDRRS